MHEGQRIVRLRQGENLPTRALYKGDLTKIVASKVEIIQSKNDTISASVLSNEQTIKLSEEVMRALVSSNGQTIRA